jgi:hypothetical protein
MPRAQVGDKISPGELIRTAEAHYTNARATTFRTQDEFLVVEARGGTTRVKTMTPANSSVLVNACKRKVPKEPQMTDAVHEATAVFQVQHPQTVTAFELAGDLPHTRFLPGDAPVVDHLAVFAQNTPGWGVLREPLNIIRRTRILDADSCKQVKEITIGMSTEKEVHDCAVFITVNLKREEERIDVCPPLCGH